MLKKILEILGIVGVILGIITGVIKLYEAFFKEKNNESKVPKFSETISEINSASRISDFLINNSDKIINLDLVLERSPFVAISEDEPHKYIYLYNETTNPMFGVLTHCYPEGLQKIRTNQDLNPIDCTNTNVLLLGNKENYSFGRSHGYYFLKGYFFVDNIGVHQGQTLVKLKSIHPSDIAYYIINFNLKD